jgi:hypothetical protein
MAEQRGRCTRHAYLHRCNVAERSVPPLAHGAPMLFSVWTFVNGLGTGIFLVSQGRIIKHMESMRSVHQFWLDEMRSQSEEIGLLWNWRNYAATVSAGTLILGILAGMVILLAH